MRKTLASDAELARKPRDEVRLTPKQQRFVDEYLVDLNGTQAAARAGYSTRTANEQAARLLAKASIQAAVQAGRASLAATAHADAERVISDAWLIATADPRELIEFRVGCCRYCWGKEFRFQRTRAELERDRTLAEDGRWEAESRRPGRQVGPFDGTGGVGFTPWRAPHPECQECHGLGEGRAVIKDTRNLSRSAAALYAGVKQTREGIEVKMHSKLDAQERLCRHLGLYDRIKAPEAALAAWAVDSATLVDQGRAVLLAAAAGHVTGAQAAQLMAGLGSLARLIETTELAARVAALEKRNG